MCPDSFSTPRSCQKMPCFKDWQYHFFPFFFISWWFGISFTWNAVLIETAVDIVSASSNGIDMEFIGMARINIFHKHFSLRTMINGPMTQGSTLKNAEGFKTDFLYEKVKGKAQCYLYFS